MCSVIEPVQLSCRSANSCQLLLHSCKVLCTHQTSKHLPQAGIILTEETVILENGRQTQNTAIPNTKLCLRAERGKHNLTDPISYPLTHSQNFPPQGHSFSFLLTLSMLMGKSAAPGYEMQGKYSVFNGYPYH